MKIKFKIENDNYIDSYFPILTQVPRINDKVVLKEEYHNILFEQKLALIVVVNDVIWNEYGVMCLVSELKSE